MSTVFYGYRVPKKNIWKMLKKVKELYLYDSRSFRCLDDETYKNYLAAQKSDDPEKLKSYIRLREFWQVNIQLFDISNSEYIFRVLEHGYYFENVIHTKLNRLGVKSFFLDTRVGEGSSPIKKTRKLVDEIDLMIREGEYFIYPVVDDNSLQEASFNRYMETLRKETKVK